MVVSTRRINYEGRLYGSTICGEKRVKKIVRQSKTKLQSLSRDLLVDVLGRVTSSSSTDVFNAKLRLVTMVADVGPPADWVKINVLETKDCFEVYALVPGLLREEVRVQSDPAGRLVITGQPEQLDNPWGISSFKKVISLPARIDPLLTSAIVGLRGQLLVKVPFEQSNL